MKVEGVLPVITPVKQIIICLRLNSFFLGLIILIASNNLARQSGKQGQRSFEATYGIIKTFHYLAPTPLRFCTEGCGPDVQEARGSDQFQLAYYQHFRPKQAISLGVGISAYSFFESGYASPGVRSTYPYNRLVKNRYMNVSLGYRFLALPGRMISPLLESRFIYDHIKDRDYFLRSGALTAAINLGLNLNISNHLSIIARGGFKSAIMNYGRADTRIKYYPYATGGDIGLA